MTDSKTKKESGWKYLLLSLGAFFGLALETVHVYGWEPIAYGHISVSEYAVWQVVLHWCITCITWIAVSFLLIHIAKSRLGFNIWAKKGKMTLLQILIILLGVILSVAMNYFAWDGFKVIQEFRHNGFVRFVFQYIYYMVETVMFLLIIVFGQKAFELWTQKPNVPWGGIICGLTWGMGHLISRGFFDISTGLSATINGFVFGAAYLLTNRDIKKSWLVLFLMFTM